MKQPDNLHVDACPVPDLTIAIDRWLAARANFKMQSTDEARHEYNSTYFALGVAFNVRYPEGVATPGAFQWYRRGIIAPEEEEPPLRVKPLLFGRLIAPTAKQARTSS
jgi:hypothetical protein